MNSLAEQIKQKGKELGLIGVGIARATPHEHFSFYRWWLEQGFSGEMNYLTFHREAKKNPQHLLPGAQSVICAAMNYYTGNPLSKDLRTTKKDHAWISNYAWGEDYHEVVKDRLSQLWEWILLRFPEARAKICVDTSPLLERSYAARAGLGWIGKNTCLIHPKWGSFVFLGEIITDLLLEPDSPLPDYCGSCTACLQACPTKALETPGVLNAEKCISYLTIEKRGILHDDDKEKLENHIAGCDICQDVCPWNNKAVMTSEKSWLPTFHTFFPETELLFPLTEESFRRQFKRSALRRLKWEGWIRNVLISAGHSMETKFIPWIKQFLSHPNDTLREAAAWALKKCS